MPDRKLPVDERCMDIDCEYILELRTERRSSRLRRAPAPVIVLKYLVKAMYLIR